MQSTTYERFAGTCAILAALGGVAYGIAFVILGDKLLYSILLMLGGMLSAVILVALYQRLREGNDSVALLALLIGLLGALGSVTHGGYDLATRIHPPGIDAQAVGSVPLQIDPRGLLTFGFSGLGLFLFASLMARSRRFPAGLANLGYVLGVLLIVIYLGRLIILDPTNIIVRIALLAGVLVNTIWFIWLGLTLRRASSAA